DLDLLSVEGDVDDTERRHRALVGELHLLVGRDAARRARAARWHIDLATARAALADDLALLDAPEEPRRGPSRREAIGQLDRRVDDLHRAHRATHDCSGSK